MTDHVLVVDDDPCLCQVLDAELTRLQYRVSVCTSAESALSRAALGDIDVILTDLNMGGMSGVELCAAIVAAGHDVPVVVMTSCGTTESVVAAIRAGAYDYTRCTSIDLTTRRCASGRRRRLPHPTRAPPSQGDPVGRAGLHAARPTERREFGTQGGGET
jgi:DNA-binding NtrC family response regulator